MTRRYIAIGILIISLVSLIGVRTEVWAQMEEEQTLDELEARHGPFERTPPTLLELSPKKNSVIVRGKPLNVVVHATDNKWVGMIWIDFDENGNGYADDLGERKEFRCVSSNPEEECKKVKFKTTFPDISGPDGKRKFNVTVFDDVELSVERRWTIQLKSSR